MKRIRSKLTYANVISSLCLILLLGGGTAYAASTLGQESVGTKQLAKEAVTGSKISKATKKSLRGATGATGATGAQGPKGDRGEQGLKGEIGPSDAYEVGEPDSASSAPPLTLSLPAGNYFASTKVSIYGATTAVYTECKLSGGGKESFLYGTVTGGTSDTTLSGSIIFKLTSPGSVELTCEGSATFGYANITAIKVGTLH
jgi:hypothetical protein